MTSRNTNKSIYISVGSVRLEGILHIPQPAKGLVLFVHGSGSSRFSPRNTFVASTLEESGIATLLIDLLSQEEDEIYENRFDIALLTQRVLSITDWLQKNSVTNNFPLAYFGSSTGAAAALRAAAQLGDNIHAIVSRGGRPDLAEEELEQVVSPTLFIVGGDDREVLSLNEMALQQLACTKKLEVVKGASHLFEQPGALEQVAHLATKWFGRYL